MARLLHDDGNKVVGIDLSKSLVEMPRNRVPEAVSRVGSFATEDHSPLHRRNGYRGGFQLRFR
jgi:hypothetical protein